MSVRNRTQHNRTHLVNWHKYLSHFFLLLFLRRHLIWRPVLWQKNTVLADECQVLTRQMRPFLLRAPFCLGWWDQSAEADQAFPHLDAEAGCKGDTSHKWDASTAGGAKRQEETWKKTSCCYTNQPTHQIIGDRTRGVDSPACCLFSHLLSAPTPLPDWGHQSQQTISGALTDTIPATQASVRAENS